MRLTHPISFQKQNFEPFGSIVEFEICCIYFCSNQYNLRLRKKYSVVWFLCFLRIMFVACDFITKFFIENRNGEWGVRRGVGSGKWALLNNNFGMHDTESSDFTCFQKNSNLELSSFPILNKNLVINRSWYCLTKKRCLSVLTLEVIDTIVIQRSLTSSITLTQTRT